MTVIVIQTWNVFPGFVMEVDNLNNF